MSFPVKKVHNLSISNISRIRLKMTREKINFAKKINFAAIDFYGSTFFQVSLEFIFTNSLSNFGEKLQYLQKLIQLRKLKSIIDAD